MDDLLAARAATTDPNPAGSDLPDVLPAILGATRCSLAARARRVPEADLERRALEVVPRAGFFRAALTALGRVNVIAECKRRSPARGVLSADYDPVALARAYAAAGAAAVSVLTEPTFFDGALDHLTAVRGAVDLPVLRKDFIVSRYQVLEARAAGADAILLIAAALDDETLRGLIEVSAALELAALVEVHDDIELDRALRAGAVIIGVNNRNLRTLVVDLATAHALIGRIPAGVVRIAESGIRTAEELRRLRAAGFDAFLLGESLVSAGDPGGRLRSLIAETGSV